MNRLVKPSDIIDFGSLKGEQFFWIYRMHTSYLEWLIKKTDICFFDLNDFYNYGKIKRLNENLSKEKNNLLMDEIMENNKPINNSDDCWLMTLNNIDSLIIKKQLIESDFEEINYTFPDDLIKANNDKLLFSNPYNSTKELLKKEYAHNFFYKF